MVLQFASPIALEPASYKTLGYMNSSLIIVSYALKRTSQSLTLIDADEDLMIQTEGNAASLEQLGLVQGVPKV